MKYTIVHIDDRCKEQMNTNKSILKDFDYVDDIEFFNGNIGNSWDVINHYGISQTVWEPYDGRKTPPLPGELGIWVSTINILKYIVDNNIDSMLVLEDDVILEDDFIKSLNLCLNDLPKSFDFLSLFYFEEHNQEKKENDIGSEYIHKPLTQYSAAQAMIYSKKGAEKILRAVKRKGIEYTTDCFIFKQAHLGLIEGYTIRPNKLKFLNHNKQVKSTIDPENIRNTNG